ncbi:Nif3-like dinuclear metal center hexameric protein [Maribacter sp. 2307ULW6-5]|uniref:Nif3-like dinuclear metal center hexameric protein n=1 Tax=Maribacter sp. 2307ULW6-5 TaxID=3386275 RepID=UPI0039BCE143
MTVSELTKTIEKLAPLADAEDFDNVGLLVGEPHTQVSGVLVTLDTLEAVVDEAIDKGCNLIVSFHPIIFGGLKKITGKNYVERTVLKAIRHNICIYATHTALDNSLEGVNAKICEVLGLGDTSILIPKKDHLAKLTTYVPKKDMAKVQQALFEAGGGNLGHYSECSFTVQGTGSFKPNEQAQPVLGTKGKRHLEEEVQLSLTFEKQLENKLIQALLKSHPYEVVAHEIVHLENRHPFKGLGMVGDLEHPMPVTEFLSLLKDRMRAKVVRHTVVPYKTVQKIAVLGGSGAFAIHAAKMAGADVLVTADIKYHEFLQAEDQLLIADIGHFETEQFTKNLLVDYLKKKIPNFAIHLSETKTNPIKYF